MPQDRLLAPIWLQFGTPNDPKMAKMTPTYAKMTPKCAKMIPKSSKMASFKNQRGSAALAKPSDPPPPGLVPGGNGVQDHLLVFMIFQDLRTCSLRPPALPPTSPTSTSAGPPNFHVGHFFSDLTFDLVVIPILGHF